MFALQQKKLPRQLARSKGNPKSTYKQNEKDYTKEYTKKFVILFSPAANLSAILAFSSLTSNLATQRRRMTVAVSSFPPCIGGSTSQRTKSPWSTENLSEAAGDSKHLSNTLSSSGRTLAHPSSLLAVLQSSTILTEASC